MKTTHLITLGLFFGLVSCQAKNEESKTQKQNNAVEKTATKTASNDDYPLEVGVVSGEKLGGMGEPFVVTHGGTEVRF